MTTQEAYDAIREHFTRPGAQLAMTVGGAQCYYRHPVDQRACAVGCLLTDDEHAELLLDGEKGGLTSAGVLHGTVNNIMSLPSFPSRLTPVIGFLRDVQPKHDGASSVEDFLARLDNLATTRGLRLRG